jgi:hypothetical protein
VLGIKHFRSRLEGRPFQLWTDHKPLIFALHRVSPLTSGRQQRHLAFISEYTNQVRLTWWQTRCPARPRPPPEPPGDRGAQFTSSLWVALCSLLNIQHNQTTAYHPQSNGMVERFHRRLKDALRTRCAVANWADHLLWVLLGLRAAAREDDNSSVRLTTHFTWPILRFSRNLFQNFS